jgi:hypothetical protein
MPAADARFFLVKKRRSASRGVFILVFIHVVSRHDFSQDTGSQHTGLVVTSSGHVVEATSDDTRQPPAARKLLLALKR